MTPEIIKLISAGAAGCIATWWTSKFLYCFALAFVGIEPKDP